MPSADLPKGMGLSDSAYLEGRDFCHQYAQKQGYAEESFVEQVVRWNHMDSFRHVNNARYVEYLEAGRIHVLDGVRARVTDSVGKKTSMVISHIGVKFVRPTFAPDVLLIAHKVVQVSTKRFEMEAILISFAHKCVVATGTATMRGFDLRQQKGRDFDQTWLDGLAPVASPDCKTDAAVKSKL